jgi:hypothetical protein
VANQRAHTNRQSVDKLAWPLHGALTHTT